MNKNVKINYLAKDFATIRESLVDYAKRYYSDTLTDLSDASINSFMIDSTAYVGDILSFYLDYQTNESFLPTAIELKNVQALAKSQGYKDRDVSSTFGRVALYLLLPAVNGSPNYQNAPTILRGTTLQTSDGTRTYITTEDVVVDSTLIGTNYVVARVDVNGSPTYYATKVYVPVVSGELTTITETVTSFSAFRKINFSNPRIVEIISVVDSDGNRYYEVPTLSENVVYKPIANDSGDSSVPSLLRPVEASRRFIFDSDSGFPYIMFGDKQLSSTDANVIDPLTNPNKFILKKYNTDYQTSLGFEPNRLITGDGFGIGPENTTLTITYRANSSATNTARVGEITSIKSLLYRFNNTAVSGEVVSNIITSIQVINEEDVVGDISTNTLTELKNVSGLIYQSQGRAVTAADYEALCYLLPKKFGSIKKVKAYRDEKSLKNNINLFVVCQNNTGILQQSNSFIKQNLKVWLSSHKVITDTIDIMDAKIVNLGVNFTVLVDPNFVKQDVLATCKTDLIEYFNITPEIGQSLNILDIYRVIRGVEGVLDIRGVTVKNLNSSGYSSTYLNIDQNLVSNSTILKMPKNAIYEIRFPEQDIQGIAV